MTNSVELSWASFLFPTHQAASEQCRCQFCFCVGCLRRRRSRWFRNKCFVSAALRLPIARRMQRLELERMPRLFSFLRFDNEPERPLSREEHSRWKIAAWCYTAIWVGVGITVKFVLPISVLIKLPIYLVLLVAAPALIDLFGTYSSYLKRRARSEENDKSLQ
jgi:hypothetical protein